MTTFEKARDYYKHIFFALAAAAFIILPVLSFGYGITYDEWLDSNYGTLVLRFMLTLGQDKEYLTFWHGYLYSCFYFTGMEVFYGLIFDTVKGIAYGGLHQDLHLLRFFTFSHVLTSLIGCLAAFYTGLLAREIGKWRTACLAFLFILFSPRFLGNSMNNPKDIPFTAAYIISLYYTVRFLKELPAPKLSTILALSAGCAAAIGVRPGGILLFPYIILASGYIWLYSLWIEKRKMILSEIAGYVLVVCVFGYMGGLLFWPYGISDPFVNPFRALAKISNFVFWNNLVLFEGKRTLASDLPWYYLPKWISISTPVFILAGIAGFLIMIRRIMKFHSAKILPFVIFTALFPTAYIIYKKSIVYDAWRHVFFVYPPLVVLAAVAWDHFFETAKLLWQKILVTALLAALFWEPASWMVRNHPNEYIYFNPLVGGLRGAWGRYETDYWLNSTRQAAEWLADYHLRVNGNQPAVVRAKGSLMCSYPYLRKKLGSNYIPYEYPPDYPKSQPYFFIDYSPLFLQIFWAQQTWDYGIDFPRSWPPELLTNKDFWPPYGTIHEIKVDGVTIAVVVKHPNSRLK